MRNFLPNRGKGSILTRNTFKFLKNTTQLYLSSYIRRLLPVSQISNLTILSSSLHFWVKKAATWAILYLDESQYTYVIYIAPPIVGSLLSWKSLLTKRSTSELLPTAASPSSTSCISHDIPNSANGYLNLDWFDLCHCCCWWKYLTKPCTSQ